jgi:ABC-2 type transport system ATP-binding protein
VSDSQAPQPPGSLALEARDLVWLYGNRRALDGFSLQVPAGSVFGLLGPNGSGKSTFIAIVAAMERPAFGELRVLHELPSPSLRARTGTVFQENTADPLMSVEEYLRFAGRLFGLRHKALSARIQELLGAFGLADRASDATETLSGGMRRRLEAARALLHDPDLLILDEPTTGVDPGERRSLWDALSATAGRRTILLATNDLAEADGVCDQVAFLSAGRVVAHGTPAELKRGLRRESVRITWDHPSEQELRQVSSWPGTGEVHTDGGVVHVTVDDAAGFIPRLFELAPGAIRAVAVETSSLEDAYFQHVQRRERPPSAVPA